MRPGSPICGSPKIQFCSGWRTVCGGLAFDDVAQRLLAAVGLGQIELVEEEEADGEDGGDGDDGNHQAVKADAGGLHGDDLRVAVEHAEGDEHGDEHSQRSDLVEQDRA